MPILSPDGLSLVDMCLLLVILLGLPIESLLSRGKIRARLASGEPGVRMTLYRQTIVLLWGVAVPILLVWLIAGRNWFELGFGAGSGWLAWAGWGLAALPAVFFFWQFQQVRRSAKFRSQYQEALQQDETMSNFLPHTRQEYRIFSVAGFTAGITEEVIFRGYLIWALGLFLPLWAAALISLGVFTLLHLYQGLKQLPMVFVLGGWFTLVFLVSGSLWPAIALHIFVDVITNGTVWAARNGGDNTPAAQGT